MTKKKHKSLSNFFPSIVEKQFSLNFLRKPRLLNFQFQWRYHHTHYISRWAQKEQRKGKIILRYPRHLHKHSHTHFKALDHPIFAHSCVMWKENSAFPSPCKHFSCLFSLSSHKIIKKFLSFEDDPLVIVGSHSKRISSFSKQRPRSFTYIVECYCLISEAAAGRRKEKHTRFFLKFNIWKWKNGNGIHRFKKTEIIVVNGKNQRTGKKWFSCLKRNKVNENGKVFKWKLKDFKVD